MVALRPDGGARASQRDAMIVDVDFSPRRGGVDLMSAARFGAALRIHPYVRLTGRSYTSLTDLRLPVAPLFHSPGVSL